MNRHFILSATIAQPELNNPAWADSVLNGADRAGIDLAVLGAPGSLPFDPMVIAAWAAPMTQRIGLVPCVSTAVAHPFHSARSLSAIDFLSSGRAAWNPIAGAGHDNIVAADMVSAARSLWDGWASDALIIDKESGRYLDGSKVRLSNYEGPHFKVRGPLNAARPLQGHPLLVADASAPFDVAGTDLVILEEGQAALPGSNCLKRAGNSPDLAALVAEFEAGEIAGVHWTLTNPGDDLREIAEFSSALSRFRQARETGSTLRERLGLPLSDNLISEGAFA
ncbi:LLM class flavin-dependent oxidoreductase [Sphingorhabdus sp. SMR4y]|uniref:LLM class flavin-dependent oxidoreductase n=1 Tax=Sphingorhabdus sp. SMR4y TaxID=2584094 RepID=UPI000B5C667C|nr:LLM class flavin-dependent oxidoreductase [Sphingorhabdus sp. SMR4y]ASK89333.1 putative monooxygenase MoxC [Sphingorhabdus sp. SMR4y]